ncbi:MAG: FKBP-type peptidyl-prolyl cis-trans isomerase [Candidatus Woesearchaeota archaeon]
MAVKKGDKIKVEYTGKLDDGTVFDTSKHEDHSHPLEFEVGSGQVIKGFDEAVIGMEKGDEKEFSLKPDQAYGERNPELKKKVPRKNLPEDQEPKVGMNLLIETPEGQKFPSKIVDMDDENLTVDLNHPLAGKNLNFEIKLLEIESEE